MKNHKLNYYDQQNVTNQLLVKAIGYSALQVVNVNILHKKFATLNKIQMSLYC